MKKMTVIFIDYIYKHGFELLVDIVQKYFAQVNESFFVDCVNCIVAFANSRTFTVNSVKAIELLTLCATELGSGRVISQYFLCFFLCFS
jgi:guanine nucleotide-exchange factor